MGTDLNISSLNLSACIANNPVNRYDADGYFSLPNWGKVAIGVGIIAVATAVTVATGGALLAAVNCAAIQRAVGAVSGAVGGAVSHRLKTGSWTGAEQAAVNGAATGFMTGTITGAVSGAVHSPYCFVAGTSVLTAVGAVAIETIETGDYVWAWNEDTGKTELKQVVETYINETDELTHVFVNGEEIISTPSHPFYSPVKGWTDACKLRAGDILVLVNGEYVVIEKVQHEILESPVKVYNFQVEDDHTYYVSDTGVLVHNKCSGADPHRSISWRTQKRNYWKSNFQTPSDLYDLSDANVALMRKGRAPIGYDGYRIELHHVEGIRNSSVIRPISHTSHVILHKYVEYKNMIKYSFN